jgi:hypothetical protein
MTWRLSGEQEKSLVESPEGIFVCAHSVRQKNEGSTTLARFLNHVASAGIGLHECTATRVNDDTVVEIGPGPLGRNSDAVSPEELVAGEVDHAIAGVSPVWDKQKLLGPELIENTQNLAIIVTEHAEPITHWRVLHP